MNSDSKPNQNHIDYAECMWDESSDYKLSKYTKFDGANGQYYMNNNNDLEPPLKKRRLSPI